MLKKLRIKFICLNMTVITIILAAILCAVVHLTGQNLERNSMQALHELASEPPEVKRPDRQQKIHEPYLLLHLDADGSVTDTENFRFPISDDDTINMLIRTALASDTKKVPRVKQNSTGEFEEKSGIFPEESIRFLYTVTPQGSCLVFLDIAGEQQMRASLIRNCLFIGVTGFLIFFLISILFARWAVKPVETAWNDQKRFVADASHELKTPLTVILTNAELLQSPECGSDTKSRLADNILIMAQEMRKLVEELLDLSRADNGSMQLAMENLDLSVIVENSLCLFEPLYFENSRTLRSEIAKNVRINGSPTHLKQVIDILLDNALKYSDKNSEVFVKLEVQHHHCLLSVTSCGDTISPADLKKIFQRFYRIDQSRTRSGSYGLGLSIAEGIVRQHHGKIWAESSNRKNIFSIRLHTV